MTTIIYSCNCTLNFSIVCISKTSFNLIFILYQGLLKSSHALLSFFSLVKNHLPVIKAWVTQFVIFPRRPPTPHTHWGVVVGDLCNPLLTHSPVHWSQRIVSLPSDVIINNPCGRIITFLTFTNKPNKKMKNLKANFFWNFLQ